MNRIVWQGRGRGVLVAGAAVLVWAGGGEPAGAQEVDLPEVIERVREAWVRHDVQGLVVGADTVRLQLPGVARVPSMRPGQAARLLERYLRPAEERAFDLRELRELAPDHAYAEMVRHYVVRGTEEERAETVFLGFRRVGERWQLREVRVTP